MSSGRQQRDGGATSSGNPPCGCGIPGKMVQVKKEGANKVKVKVELWTEILI